MPNNQHVYIELGGNIGDTKLYFDTVYQVFAENRIKITQKSSIYETAPWGFEASQPFLNQVLVIETNLSPIEFLKFCQQVEKHLGRQRGSKQYISRIIDIDILLWKDEIIELPNLKVPHPMMAQRKFVLQPLNEVRPDLVHPIYKISISKMLEQCEDSLKCQRVSY
jgi:2-amino-4-hydroxy-6-hydroxymethyldihydropteridine diphosphokinase